MNTKIFILEKNYNSNKVHKIIDKSIFQKLCSKERIDWNPNPGRERQLRREKGAWCAQLSSPLQPHLQPLGVGAEVIGVREQYGLQSDALSQNKIKDIPY